MTSPPVAFIVCLEKNATASQAILLFASIREFGGRFAEAPIYSFNPRGLGPLEPWQYEQLRSLEVRHTDEILNGAYPDFPQANKVYAAAFAESAVAEEILVMLDADSVVLNEPDAFALPEAVAAAATPVWATGLGSRGPHDPAAHFWQSVRQTCSIDGQPPRVRTRLTQEEIDFYCNSGLVVARRTARIYTRWRWCFERLAVAPRVHEMPACGPLVPGRVEPRFFLEQVALTAALVPVVTNVILLDNRYNCPLHNRDLLRRSFPEQRFDLDSICHFHYNQSLHNTGFLASLIPPLDASTRQYQWLSERLPLHPAVSLDESGFIAEFDRWMEEWREAMKRRFFLEGASETT